MRTGMSQEIKSFCYWSSVIGGAVLLVVALTLIGILLS